MFPLRLFEFNNTLNWMKQREYIVFCINRESELIHLQTHIHTLIHTHTHTGLGHTFTYITNTGRTYTKHNYI
jgi:hypothetical protein